MAELYVSVFQADLSLTHVTQSPGELTSYLSSTLNVSTPSLLPSPDAHTTKATPTSCLSTSSQEAAEKIDDASSSNAQCPSPTSSTSWDSAGRDSNSATPPTIRRKLFNGVDKENVCHRDVQPTLGAGDLSATILLEEYKENLCASQAVTGCVVNNGSSPVLGEASKEKSWVIPTDILGMSDKELRKKLVSHGERPGPIVDSTRLAYQSYLSKLLAGIQPSGNTGYKGIYKLSS